MERHALDEHLERCGHVVRLEPQVVGRFYRDGNRLGQRGPDAPAPDYYRPERWIGSSTPASSPPGIPPGGLSICAGLGDGEPVTLRALLADPEIGPRLLGDERYVAHGGELRVLVKLLDPAWPIPFHVHAPDAFVAGNPEVYPDERFGKDEAYHFLETPKGDCPYTHLGIHDGVGPDEVLAAMGKSTDHVLELSPGAYQRYGEGFYVPAGLLHRPGTALTLEIQQPSDVYALFQTELGGQPLAPETMHPGFDSQRAAAEETIDWPANRRDGLLEANRLTPTPVSAAAVGAGARAEWIYPPEMCDHFSGMRLTVETEMTFQVRQPCVLFVWRGRGTLDGLPIDGGGGPAGEADELFVSLEAASRGLRLDNTGDEPLVVFALFAATMGGAEL